MNDFKNNSPVADFYCAHCKEEYELKSKKDEMGKKIVDGAYQKMIERLSSTNNPSFFFLNYNLNGYKVQNSAISNLVYLILSEKNLSNMVLKV